MKKNKFEIRDRYSGSVLFALETESFKMCVEAAIQGGANLWGAKLWGAKLQGADLRGAKLHGADLQGANLRGAKGINKHRCTPLTMLLDQPGKIRAYKLVNGNMEGPYQGGILYEIGKSYQVDDANTDDTEHCGAGINIATLDWCMKEWKDGYHILIVEFTAADIACIPIATDGKFRVHRCKVVGEKDLKEIGLATVTFSSRPYVQHTLTTE